MTTMKFRADAREHEAWYEDIAPEELIATTAGQPPTHDLKADNVRRAGHALVALRRYGELTGVRDEDAETAWSDLYADLLHLADVLGVDVAEARDSAKRRYAEEIDGDV